MGLLKGVGKLLGKGGEEALKVEHAAASIYRAGAGDMGLGVFGPKAESIYRAGARDLGLGQFGPKQVTPRLTQSIEQALGQTESEAKQHAIRTAGRSIGREFGGQDITPHFEGELTRPFYTGYSPVEHTIFSGARVERREAEMLRGEAGRAAEGDVLRSRVFGNVAASKSARASRMEASLDKTLGRKTAASLRPRLEGDDVSAFARSKARQRKLVAKRTGTWRKGAKSLTEGTGIRRQIVEAGGMKMSVYGEMPAAAHMQYLFEDMKAAAAESPDVAAGIEHIQLMNRPGKGGLYGPLKADKEGAYGLAHRGGYPLGKSGRATKSRIRMDYDLMSQNRFGLDETEEALAKGHQQWTVGKKGEHFLGEVFTHEFGHHWDYARGVSDVTSEKGLTETGRRFYAQAFGAPPEVLDPDVHPGFLKRTAASGEDPTHWQARTRAHVGTALDSRYSKTNAAELTAETYAAARLGHPQAKAFVESMNAEEAARPLYGPQQIAAAGVNNIKGAPTPVRNAIADQHLAEQMTKRRPPSSARVGAPTHSSAPARQTNRAMRTKDSYR